MANLIESIGVIFVLFGLVAFSVDGLAILSVFVVGLFVGWSPTIKKIRESNLSGWRLVAAILLLPLAPLIIGVIGETILVRQENNALVNLVRRILPIAAMVGLGLSVVGLALLRFAKDMP